MGLRFLYKLKTNPIYTISLVILDEGDKQYCEENDRDTRLFGFGHKISFFKNENIIFLKNILNYILFKFF